MLEATHRRIAKKIAKALHLGKHEAALLERGSVEPDSWADFPHHKGKYEEIERNIVSARRLYWEDDDECFFNLGVALHYIEDGWTLAPRLKDKHTKWEQEINNCKILDDAQFRKEIEAAVIPTKAIKAYLDLLTNLLEGRLPDSYVDLSGRTITLLYNYRPLDYAILHELYRGVVATMSKQGIKTMKFSSPVIDLNFAYRTCLEVSRLVLSPSKDPDEDKIIEDKLAKHY